MRDGEKEGGTGRGRKGKRERDKSEERRKGKETGVVKRIGE